MFISITQVLLKRNGSKQQLLISILVSDSSLKVKTNQQFVVWIEARVLPVVANKLGLEGETLIKL